MCSFAPAALHSGCHTFSARRPFILNAQLFNIFYS
jgi:hypothetical protein